MRLRLPLALLLALAAGPLHAFPVERFVNLSNFLEVPRDDAWTYDFRAEHLKQISDAGFDTLRLPINAGDWWVHGRLDARFRRLITDVVTQAQEAGLFVIIDLHHYDRFLAAPDEYGGQFVAIWKTLAEMFENTERLAFELLNEPTDDNETKQMQPHYANALATIRKRHPDAWVIFGGANWNHLHELEALAPVSDPRVVHTFHYYSPYFFTHQRTESGETAKTPIHWDGDVAAIKRDMQLAADHHTPVFLGEFGVIESAPPEDRKAWLEAVRRAAEVAEIPWCHWGFGAGFGLFDPETGRWRDDHLDLLMAQ